MNTLLKQRPQWLENLVSILLPNFNSGNYLNEAVDSVLQQSYTEWELIIVDDASTDRSREIAARLAKRDPRIRVLFHSQNQGAAHARNTALKEARGRHVALLDSDDLWLPQKLQYQLEFMRKTGTAISYTSYRKMNANKSRISLPIPIPTRLTRELLLKHNQIPALTAMIDRNRAGDFRFRNVGHEDYLLWLELLGNSGAAAGLPMDLARYRLTGKSSLSYGRIAKGNWVWRIYRKHMGLSVLKSAFLFAQHAVIGSFLYWAGLPFLAARPHEQETRRITPE
ncbi:MAG: glycosyltransferase family 2 protein [Bdellovibrionota bacterium]